MVYCTYIGPFRVSEGEASPEQCKPADAIGWETYRDGGPRYFYKTKREAVAASDILEFGGFPENGRAWWTK